MLGAEESHIDVSPHRCIQIISIHSLVYVWMRPGEKIIISADKKLQLIQVLAKFGDLTPALRVSFK